MSILAKQESAPVATAHRLRLGAEIAEARTAKGLSIRALADLSGVAYTNISKIETGKYNASIDVLTKILTPLGKKLTITDTDS